MRLAPLTSTLGLDPMLHLRWSLIGIGIAITLLLVTEYQINTVPAAAALRLKSIPAFVALASFIVVYLVYWYKVRPKITTGLAVFVGSLVLLSVIGIPLWFLVGCASGPVCL